MMTNTQTIKRQMILAYLLNGNGSQFQALRAELLSRGGNRTDVIETIIAAKLYGSAENFYRKHPTLTQ